MLRLLILSQDYQRNTYISINLSSVPRELIKLPSPGTFHMTYVTVTQSSPLLDAVMIVLRQQSIDKCLSISCFYV